MKKLLFVCSLFAMMFSLTSCTVNWFDEHFVIPWIIGFAILLAIIIIVLIVTLKNFSSKYRTCTKCNHKFKPKWYKCFSAIFIGEKNTTNRLFKCPHCQEKSLMPVSYDQDEE